MIYWLADQLQGHFSWLNVFGYLTFRAVVAALTGLILSLLLGGRFIAWLQVKQIGQQVRKIGPESHLSKQGTPTMGGSMILFIIVLATLLWADLSNHYIWLSLFVIIGFGLIGWLDDFKKIHRKN